MIQNKLAQIKEIIKELKTNEAFLEDTDLLAFMISLLPIPGVQQAGQIASKIVTNQNLKFKFNDINDKIHSVNKKVISIENELERIQAIANTVNSVSFIEEEVEAFKNELQGYTSEFLIDTREGSLQTVIKQIIDTDFVSISAVDHSHNVIKETKLNSKRTHLTAINNSSNFIDGTELNGTNGGVKMNGVEQYGYAKIEGNDVTIRAKQGVTKSGINIRVEEKINIKKSQCKSCEAIIYGEYKDIINLKRCPKCNITIEYFDFEKPK